MKIPHSHPRYESLIRREKLADGVERGLVHITGLIAHGRGEAFDYLIGETTIPPALEAEKAAVAALMLAKNPVISVNGNTAVLAGEEVIEFAKEINAKIEVNIFHRTEERLRKLVNYMKSLGAERIYGLEANAKIPGLDQPRSICSYEGIYSADVILVPLEDGDRCEALVKMGKIVIAIDLNPLSRTARTATITIVDDVTRAFRNMITIAKELKSMSREELEEVLKKFDNKENLNRVLNYICKRLKSIYKSSLEDSHPSGKR
ncbi:MAG: hypothetical protein DRG59_11715 [Deltaproteobacteria bacterium]|nr:MAG: hypothetical protein DRG59_11715 [Deltaproteobacteria bacterium]